MAQDERSWARKALAMEADGWRSLWRWVARRPRVSAGAQGFGYSGPTSLVFGAILGVSVVEVVVVDLIVHQWPIPRAIALVIGIWGVTFGLGMIAGLRVNPHEVGDAGVVVRHGARISHRFGWEQVLDVAQRRQVRPETRTVQVDEDGPVLNVVVGSETNVVIRLRDAEFSEVRCYADDAAGMVRAAHERLGARSARP